MKRASLEFINAARPESMRTEAALLFLWLSRSGLWIQIPELAAIVEKRVTGCTLAEVCRHLMERCEGDWPL